MAIFICTKIVEALNTMSLEDSKAFAERLFSNSKPLLRVVDNIKDVTVRYPEPIGLLVYANVAVAEKDARQFIRLMAGHADNAKYTAATVAVFKGSVSQVTQVQVYPLAEPIGKTKALARVVLNDEIQLTGLRVIDGTNGLFVAYPNDPGYKGEDFRSIFYPITRELREHIEEVVLVKYHEMVDKAS